jgi:molybdopterin synthase sulfur carrier subunit
MPKVTVQYFAILREQRGLAEESLETTATTAVGLYEQLSPQTGFTLPAKSLRVAINDEFAPMDQPLKDGDTVTFIAPVAGG